MWATFASQYDVLKTTMLKKLLLVDDDLEYCKVLARGLSRRQLDVHVAHNNADALAIALESAPDFALVDLWMPGESGLHLIPRLKQVHPDIRIVVLTGYASVATAVEAVKLGAMHYLCKPVSIGDIESAFETEKGNPDQVVDTSTNTVTLDKIEQAHIQNALLQNNGNISETARFLNMHRRTLQRKLARFGNT